MNMELKEHHNFYCDLCLQNPIQNARYRCVICTDFDVCSACHAKGDHRNPQKLPTRNQGKHDVFAHPLIEIWSTKQAAWVAIQQKMNPNTFMFPSSSPQPPPPPPDYFKTQPSPSYAPTAFPSSFTPQPLPTAFTPTGYPPAPAIGSVPFTFDSHSKTEARTFAF